MYVNANGKVSSVLDLINNTEAWADAWQKDLDAAFDTKGY